MALFYAIVYLTYQRDLLLARSSIMLFMMFYGILVFLNTHGVDLFRISTVRDHRGYALLGLGLTVLTVAGPYVAPQIFRFVPLSPVLWLFLVASFLITAVALNLALRNRQFFRALGELLTA